MKYLMIHYLDESTWLNSDGSEQEDPAFDQAIDAWVTEMETTGVKVSGGRSARSGTPPRSGSGTARYCSATGRSPRPRSRSPAFDVIECASMDEAIEIAARHPTAEVGTFELRPFWPQS